MKKHIDCISLCLASMFQSIFDFRSFFFVICLFSAKTSYVMAVEIAKEAQAKSAIIIPDTTLPVVKYAAEELQYHIREASGVTLEIIAENKKPKVESGYIYLGACNATMKSHIDTQQLPANSFLIKTVGDDLFISGHDSDGEVLGMLINNTTRCGTLFGVYTFLEEQLDVRWLWPGKLGEIIPKRSTIEINQYDKKQIPQLTQRRIRDGDDYGIRDEKAWFSQTTAQNYLHDQSVWLRRHQCAIGTAINAGHAFIDYWERFGKTHPEYFNLLPDGRRFPDPYYFSSDPSLVSMCVSNPGLWKQVVKDWEKKRTPQVPGLNLCENDTAGKCTCPNCLAWDAPDPELGTAWSTRLDMAKQAFLAKDREWPVKLGSLSDRYAKFQLAVQKETQKIDPNVIVVVYGYANYSNPPVATKLNDHIVVGVVPALMYPWTEKKRLEFRQQWDGWYNAGARCYLRPNYLMDGHNMPIFFADKFGEDFSYAYQRGMIATDFDSLRGQWGTQGPNLYVVARMQTCGDWPVGKILNEYYSGFGPASEAVREYFEYWKKISDAVTDESMAEEFRVKRPEGGSWPNYYQIADLVFTPAVMNNGQALLEKAKTAAQTDPIAQKRVAFLEKGLKNAQLTLAAQAAFRAYKETGNGERLFRAINELDSFRTSVEGDYISNMGNLMWSESRTWDRKLIKQLEKPGAELVNWKFMWDPNNQGIEKRWYVEDVNHSQWHDISVRTWWEDQEVGKTWKAQHGSDYDGYAWYRTTFVSATTDKSKKVQLIFGAVDEACQIWVNGTLVLNRPYPYQGDPDSWCKSFDVDITNVLHQDAAKNTIAVQVHDAGGKGGIWKSVWLKEQ